MHLTPTPENDPRLRPTLAHLSAREQEYIAQYTIEQQRLIRERLGLLAVTANAIGEDFHMPIELNEPGKGWYWDFEHNIVRIDPKDLLERDIEELRFIAAHEGSHRRISRMTMISKGEWKQPGFGFMMNVVEDPRVNNFLADCWPALQEGMEASYARNMAQGHLAEAKRKAEGILDRTPKFLVAGFELLRLWVEERAGRATEIRADLPEVVRAAVEAMLTHAQESWWSYPSRAEADADTHGDATVTAYADGVYRNNVTSIWPIFRALIEQDQKEQELQDLLREMMESQGGAAQESPEGESGEPQEPSAESPSAPGQSKGADAPSGASEAGQESPESDGGDAANEIGTSDNAKPGKGAGIPQELRDKLSPEEAQALSDALEAGAMSEETERADALPKKRIDPSALPEALRKKLREYMESRPDAEKDARTQAAAEKIRTAEQLVDDALQGSLTRNPEQAATADVSEDPTPATAPSSRVIPSDAERAAAKQLRDRAADEMAEVMRTLEQSEGQYERMRREVLPLIRRLEDELRDTFRKRREIEWEAGYDSGDQVDIQTRIQEKAKGALLTETKSLMRSTEPLEKDYALTLLLDLSGSMRGAKIRESFKALIVIAEALKHIDLPIEILGFNDRMHEFLRFGQQLDDAARTRLLTSLAEVDSSRAQYNDDGWALQQASRRLAARPATEQILIVLSDGVPEPSPAHASSKYDLAATVKAILKETSQHLVGLGIQTDSVDDYYPDHLQENDVTKLAEKLAALIRRVIEQPRR